VDSLDPGPLPTVPGEFLFVSSPTARCGTTVVQRLLCSSPHALVFGEYSGGALVEFAQALATRSKLLTRTEMHRTDLARALAGEQFWYPHLLGDAPGFVELFHNSLVRCLAFHQEQARACGRPLWGVKLPTVPVETLRNLRALCPDSKVLYVVRDLVAAARSAKARRFVRNLAELEHFATTWREGVLAIESLRADPRVCVLDYEAIERRDTGLLSELEAFTGMCGLDPAVLAARVNTWEGQPEKGHAPGQYLAPCELDEDELDVLERVVRFALTTGPGEIVAARRR